MPAQRKFSNEQWEYLQSLVPEYQEHRAQKKKRIFFDNLETQWAKRFPELEELKHSMPEVFAANAKVPSNNPAHLGEEDNSGLPPFVWTPAIESQYNEAVRTRNRQLVNWYTNHTKDVVGVGKTSDRINTDLEETEGRKRAPQVIEVYQRMFKDTIKRAVELDRAERPLPLNYVLPPGLTKPPLDVVQSWRQTSRRTLIISMWARESAENIAKVTEQCRREREQFAIEQAALKIVNAEAYGLARDPERRARFIAGLVARLEHWCKEIQRLCGWSAFMVVAGPNPSLNEKIMLHTVSAAYQDAAAPFPETYRDYDEHVGDPITRWMKGIYRNHRSTVALNSSPEASTSRISPEPSFVNSTPTQTENHRINSEDGPHALGLWPDDDDNLDAILGADEFSGLITLGDDQFHANWENFAFNTGQQQQPHNVSGHFQGDWDIFSSSPTSQWPQAPNAGSGALPMHSSADQFPLMGMGGGSFPSSSSPIRPANSTPSRDWSSPIRPPLNSTTSRNGSLVQLAELSSNIRRFGERYNYSSPTSAGFSTPAPEYLRSGPSADTSSPFPLAPPQVLAIPRVSASRDSAASPIPTFTSTVAPRTKIVNPQPSSPAPPGAPPVHAATSVGVATPCVSVAVSAVTSARPAGPVTPAPARTDPPAHVAQPTSTPPATSGSPVVEPDISSVASPAVPQRAHLPRITNFGGAFKQGKASAAAAQKAERQAAIKDVEGEGDSSGRGSGRGRGRGHGRGRGRGRGGARATMGDARSEVGESGSKAQAVGSKPFPRTTNAAEMSIEDSVEGPVPAPAGDDGGGQWQLYTDPNDPHAVVAPGPALRAHIAAMNKQSAPKRGQKRKAAADPLHNPDGNHPLHVYCPPQGSELNPMSVEAALSESESRRASKRVRVPKKTWGW